MEEENEPIWPSIVVDDEYVVIPMESATSPDWEQ